MLQIAGIVGRQLTLGKRASTMSRFSTTLPRNPSSAAALLQSGDPLDFIPAGSEHRRRSSSMGHMQGPLRLLSRATSRFQDYAPRDTRYVNCMKIPEVRSRGVGRGMYEREQGGWRKGGLSSVTDMIALLGASEQSFRLAEASETTASSLS